jgi:hypothetical protein
MVCAVTYYEYCLLINESDILRSIIFSATQDSENISLIIKNAKYVVDYKIEMYNLWQKKIVYFADNPEILKLMQLQAEKQGLKLGLKVIRTGFSYTINLYNSKYYESSSNTSSN